MEIKEIAEQKIWDRFVTSGEDYTFLQSWSWGEFQKTLGEKVWRLGIFENSALLWICQVISISAKRGKFLFVPHGPVILREMSREVLNTFLGGLKKIAKENGCLFIRVSPWVEATDRNKMIFRELGFRSAPMMMHAEETWLVPLSGGEEEILGRMRKTHRNLIRRAMREKVQIEIKNEQKDIQKLYDLQLEAVKRHKFVPFSLKYLETEFEIFSQNRECAVFLGKYHDEVLAAALIIFYGKFAFYFQSGSKKSLVPVNYLLQWEVIREARRRGCKIYNMWGVTAENRANESGLLMFKSGFGGYRKDYLHAQDLVLSSKYWLTYALEKVPRAWRAKL